MSENYKRATFIVEPDGNIDLKIEGDGPMILTHQQYRIMALAVIEMVSGHAALCWQDHIPNVGYIRVAKRKYLCNVKCTRHGVQIAKKPEPLRSERVPLIPHTESVLPERIKAFSLYNNQPIQLLGRKGIVS